MSIIQLTKDNYADTIKLFCNDINELYKHLSPSNPTVTTHQMMGFFLEKLRQGHFVLFAFEEDELAGTVTLYPETKLYGGGKRVLHLEDLVVFPEFRGLGIATELIFSSKLIMKKLECEYIILRCSNQLRSFYKQNGFDDVGISMKYS